MKAILHLLPLISTTREQINTTQGNVKTKCIDMFFTNQKTKLIQWKTSSSFMDRPHFVEKGIWQ